jgi:formate dehydrogenase subunit delta
VSEQGLDSDLVRMANQIARQSGSLPDDEAATEVARHLHRFWEPRMLVGLRAHAAASPDDLDPVVLAAIAVLGKDHGEAPATG